MIKRANYKYILIALIGFLSVQNAKAVELSANTTPVQDATAKIEASHDALLNIEDNATITDAEKAEKSVEARKEIISDAIKLALTEISTLQTSLKKLPDFTKDSIESNLQAKFIAELETYEKYYKDKSDKLESVLTVDEAKLFAKEIIDYRTNTYNPAIEKMAEFQLVFYTDETINIAKTRISKILADIKKLEKLNLFKGSTVSAKMDKASELLKTATDKYLKARELVVKEEAPLEPAAEPSTITIDPIVTNISIEVEVAAPTAKELIESSLTDVKSTYEIFIQISRDIRKSLGLR